MRELAVRKGDQVVILAGRFKGTRGKILRVEPSKDRVWVEKANFVKKHQRQSEKHPQGGIIEKEAPIHISNVRLICPACGALTSAKRVVKENEGVKERLRVCAKCGEELR